jgi:hypothetical protein
MSKKLKTKRNTDIFEYISHGFHICEGSLLSTEEFHLFFLARDKTIGPPFCFLL